MANEMKYTVLPERLPLIPKDKMTEEQRKEAAELTQRLGELGQSDKGLKDGAPKPTPALRIRPSF